VASQVLKVAHHGAKTSSSADFLARVSPQVAVVTAESGGLSNLPNPLTLDRLRAAQARIFRTDLDGAVTVILRGRSMAVQGFAPLRTSRVPTNCWRWFILGSAVVRNAAA